MMILLISQSRWHMAETLTYVTIWNWYCCRYFDWSRHEILSYNDLASPSDKNDGITVLYDGTCRKRGHTSLYGISIVVDILTGLAIDNEILSKYCPECILLQKGILEDTVLISPYSTKPTGQNTAKTMWDHQMPWTLKLQKFYGRIHLKTVVCDT
ncbi:hypothetical protein AVEN_145634-1 [Araneus ventricosus]|uniref:Uncharacterized protein n=1 Tax=Araneus ventricosus TaxID=182803 RepID=A0A4Y2ULG9_ARAVE|nr:hypothetical protein AVEN_145634-1 [Araneus ventricosus]